MSLTWIANEYHPRGLQMNVTHVDYKWMPPTWIANECHPRGLQMVSPTWIANVCHPRGLQMNATHVDCKWMSPTWIANEYHPRRLQMNVTHVYCKLWYPTAIPGGLDPSSLPWAGRTFVRARAGSGSAHRRSFQPGRHSAGASRLSSCIEGTINSSKNYIYRYKLKGL